MSSVDDDSSSERVAASYRASSRRLGAPRFASSVPTIIGTASLIDGGCSQNAMVDEMSAAMAHDALPFATAGTKFEMIK